MARATAWCQPRDYTRRWHILESFRSPACSSLQAGTLDVVPTYLWRVHGCRLGSLGRRIWSSSFFYVLNHHQLSCFLQAGKLDVVLTYLWRVHGLDYYGGAEVAEPEEEQRAGPRPTLRCPRPEEGEQPAEGAEKEQVPRLSLARALPVRALLSGSCTASANICVLCSTAALLTALPAPR